MAQQSLKSEVRDRVLAKSASLRDARKQIIDKANSQTLKPQESPQEAVQTPIDDLSPVSSTMSQALQQSSTSNEIGRASLDELHNISESSKLINQRLQKLSTLLESKFVNAETKPVELNERAVDVIKDYVEKPEQKVPEPNPIPKLLPGIEYTSSLGDTKDDQSKTVDQKEKREDANGTGVKSILKTGFGKTVSVIDRISGFLFKYTLSAAIASAKIVGGLFALILGFDLLRIHFKYWGEKLMEKFDQISDWFGENISAPFNALLERWTPVFESIMDSVGFVKRAWENGDWGALISGIGSAIDTATTSLLVGIQSALAKLGAAILDKLGFKDAADNLEGAAIQNKQNHTDAVLSDKEKIALAEYQKKNIEKGEAPSRGGITSFLPDSWRKNLDLITEQDYNQIKAEEKDMGRLKSMSSDDQTKVLIKNNEAKDALDRYAEAGRKLDVNNEQDKARLNKLYNEASTRVKDKDLSNTPEVQKHLEGRLERIKNSINAKKVKVEPAPSNESKDATTASRIQAIDSKKNSSAGNGNASNTNVQNNIVKSNRQINIQAPVTSSNAPGIFKATSAN
ncbi:gp29 baseplate hub subunit [Acinetobacter phage Ac42]|uniref:baseplate hub subunit and tail length n=1 Tax=Acinetobacter phage Ac42 TaxID=762660 RepID=UPI0001EBCDBF|nr:baseplate hub subunit and tail length [Acinetobacter phage Ac42]ADI96435.1 gp29 baseplate hub subunit [Acinetobacter phage Ac42]